MAETFEDLDAFLALTALPGAEPRLRQRIATPGFTEYALQYFLDKRELRRFTDHQALAPEAARALLSARPELFWVGQLHDADAAAGRPVEPGVLRAVCESAVQFGLSAEGERLAVLGGVAALAAAALGQETTPTPIDARAKAHFRYLRPDPSQPAEGPGGADERLPGLVSQHGVQGVLDLLPVYADSSAFWSAVVLVDRDRWNQALCLDEHPRLKLLVGTVLFRALWHSKAKPDLDRLVTEAPQLRPWTKVLSICLELAERSSRADLARLGA